MQENDKMHKNNRLALEAKKIYEIRMDDLAVLFNVSIYTVKSYFRREAPVTISDKRLRIMRGSIFEARLRKKTNKKRIEQLRDARVTHHGDNIAQ